MSRIHEALKKAAQERSHKHSENGNLEAPEVFVEGPAATEIPSTVPGASVAEAWSASVLPHTSQVKQFLDGCPHTAWNVEPKLSVFSSQANAVRGAERFRTLRSRLLQISAVQPLHRILVTSSLPEEGKTFVAANLAQTFVYQSDRRVLMIDADMRAPRLHVHFGTTYSPGLSEYLLGQADETEILQVGPEGNLCLIPGGNQVPDASELVHSERMKSLLDRMSEIFDCVILDSPPALAVHDASILSDICDGVIFVVRAGQTDSEVAERAAGEFRKKNLLGVVLNRADESDTYGGYYGDYYQNPSRNGAGKKK